MKNSLFVGVCRSLALLILIGFFSIPLVGCASSKGHTFQTSYELPGDLNVRGLTMFNGRTGEQTTWHELLKATNEADIVLIGEQHGHVVGLATASALFTDAIMDNPSVALSMEFFERDQQIGLDDYLKDLSNEEKFRIAARRSPGNYPAGHREMIETAKREGRPVIAANPPRRYVTLSRKEGAERIAQLSSTQQAMLVLPEDVPSEGEYRDRFFEAMGIAHPLGDDESAASDEESHLTPEEQAKKAEDEKAHWDMVESFFWSQNVWDATMADSVLRGTASGYKPVMHVVGQFHSDYQGGTYQRILKGNPEVFVWTVSMVDEWSETLREEDEDRADCVIYVGPHTGR